VSRLRSWLSISLGALLFVLPATLVGATEKPLGPPFRLELPRSSNVEKYGVGSPIPALKLSRLEMLNSNVGVGVAPLTTDGGRLVRALLVETNDGATSWKVTGTIPTSFGYPWLTAFRSPRQGYLIGSGSEVLYTSNAGRTWATVASRGSPSAISVKGSVVWLATQLCPGTDMGGVCSELVESYKVGSLVPEHVSKLALNAPVIVQVAPNAGYAIESNSTGGKILFTSNDGVSWRALRSPCAHRQLAGGAVSSRSHLFAVCQPLNSPPSDVGQLWASVNGGSSWTSRSVSPPLGFATAASGNGEFIWTISPQTLEVGSRGGRAWTSLTQFRDGLGGDLATFGATEAWCAYVGHGIFRTLNGSSWSVLK
jgi:hypothetical protein